MNRWMPGSSPGHDKVNLMPRHYNKNSAAGGSQRQLRVGETVLPGVAPVAMQEGRYAARVVRDRLAGRTTPPFRYVDKGNLATIGRAAAVADIKGLKLSGFLAWITWLVVHLWYLVGFQNRILVFIRWSASFLTHGRGDRLITNS